MISTRNVTGGISFPDDRYPVFSSVEFVLTGIDVNGYVVIPKIVSAQVAANGTFDVDLWPNELGYQNTKYKVFFVEYSNSFRNVETSRRYLGDITVLDIEGQTLQGLLDAGSFETLPSDSCLLFLRVQSDVQQLCVLFSNGTTKVIENWTP